LVERFQRAYSAPSIRRRNTRPHRRRKGKAGRYQRGGCIKEKRAASGASFLLNCVPKIEDLLASRICVFEALAHRFHAGMQVRRCQIEDKA